jgi:hypothetical protein
MKIFRLALGCLLLSLFSTRAQITVEVVPEQAQFLACEDLIVAVRVSNMSGKTLQLGAAVDWLKLSVESRDGFVVSRSSEVPVQGEFTLESSKRAVKRVNIAPHFSLSKPGRYNIIATVRIPGWEQEFLSPPGTFDIIRGLKLWETEFGLPTTNAAAGVPEVRKFVLQQANYLKQLQLYVRVTDNLGEKTLAVRSIGRMVSFSAPEAQVDKFSRLHVLWQTGARGFAYRTVNPDGEVIVSQTYDYTTSRPKLRLKDDGEITVSGGQRRLTRDDVPAATPPVAPPAAKP